MEKPISTAFAGTPIMDEAADYGASLNEWWDDQARDLTSRTNGQYRHVTTLPTAWRGCSSAQT